MIPPRPAYLPPSVAYVDGEEREGIPGDPLPHTFRAGEWRIDPEAITLGHWRMLLSLEEAGQETPGYARDVILRTIRHPAIPPLRNWSRELFGVEKITPDVVNRIIDWLCANHGVGETDTTEVTLEEVEKLLREAVHTRNTPPAPEPVPKAIRALAGGVSSGLPASRRTGMKLATANQISKNLYRERGHDFLRQPATQWARAIGCSVGTVTRLDLWIEHRRERAGMSRSAKPKAVAFTKAIEASIGSQDELARLIAEQSRDYEPSPLDDDRRQVRHRKRV